MKATGTISKCRPGRSGAGTAPSVRPSAHLPQRRPTATPEPRCAAVAPASVAASSTRPLDALVLHGAPQGVPHVLHIDSDPAAALALAVLLMPEARVTHVPTLAAARAILQQQIFAVVVLDPSLADGDAAELLPALTAIPLVVYSAVQPVWRERSSVYLPKPWTSPRQLWTTLARLLGIQSPTCAGD